MLVDIDDRTYSDFIAWASANGMSDEEALKYINRAFRDRFMTDKYGDLNEKFANPEPKNEPKPDTPGPKTETPKEEELTQGLENKVDAEPEEEEPKPKQKRKILKSK